MFARGAQTLCVYADCKSVCSRLIFSIDLKQISDPEFMVPFSHLPSILCIVDVMAEVVECFQITDLHCLESKIENGIKRSPILVPLKAKGSNCFYVVSVAGNWSNSTTWQDLQLLLLSFALYLLSVRITGQWSWLKSKEEKAREHLDAQQLPPCC